MTKKYNYTIKTGRPAHFKDSEKLYNAFLAYVMACKKTDRPLTVSGFCCSIDSYRDMLSEYAKKPEFSSTIKRIYSSIENDLEERALSNLVNGTVAIFSLKNNFGWKDKQEVESNNTNHNMNAEISAQELKEEIRKARLEKNNG